MYENILFRFYLGNKFIARATHFPKFDGCCLLEHLSFKLKFTQ